MADLKFSSERSDFCVSLTQYNYNSDELGQISFEIVLILSSISILLTFCFVDVNECHFSNRGSVVHTKMENMIIATIAIDTLIIKQIRFDRAGRSHSNEATPPASQLQFHLLLVGPYIAVAETVSVLCVHKIELYSPLTAVTICNAG